VHQWQAGLLSDLFDIADFMLIIQGFTDINEPRLRQQINQAHLNWANGEGQTYANRINNAEIDAYTISDPVLPMFAYQRCGRTQF
jgi:hypothetical protein